MEPALGGGDMEDLRARLAYMKPCLKKMVVVVG